MNIYDVGKVEQIIIDNYNNIDTAIVKDDYNDLFMVLMFNDGEYNGLSWSYDNISLKKGKLVYSINIYNEKMFKHVSNKYLPLLHEIIHKIIEELIE